MPFKMDKATHFSPKSSIDTEYLGQKIEFSHIDTEYLVHSSHIYRSKDRKFQDIQSKLKAAPISVKSWSSW